MTGPPPGPQAANPAAAVGARRLAGVVLGVGILLAAVGFADLAGNVVRDEALVTVTVERPDAVLDDVDGLPAGSRLALTDERAVDLVIPGLSVWQRALSGVAAAATGILALAGAWLVRSLLLLVAAGRPLDRRVASRLRALAAVVVAATLLPPALDGLASAVILTGLGGLDTGGVLGVDLYRVELLPLLVAAVLAVSAQVVTAGRQQSGEQGSAVT